jgi:hypothetical protein
LLDKGRADTIAGIVGEAVALACVLSFEDGRFVAPDPVANEGTSSDGWPM